MIKILTALFLFDAIKNYKPEPIEISSIEHSPPILSFGDLAAILLIATIIGILLIFLCKWIDEKRGIKFEL